MVNKDIILLINAKRLKNKRAVNINNTNDIKDIIESNRSQKNDIGMLLINSEYFKSSITTYK